MLRLIVRNLTKHGLRSVLTMGSLVVAIFLLCTLRSLVTTLNAGTEAAKSNRLWVQSAVSLFVSMPLSYQRKIEEVDGVLHSSKVQWFGGYYQSLENFFAQFAIDQDEYLRMYPEIEIFEGSGDAFSANRTGCLIGDGIAAKYGFKVGDTIPIIGVAFQKNDRSAWEFKVEGIYRPTKPTWDNQTLFFHWDYFQETMEAAEQGLRGVGTVVVETDRTADQTRIMANIDALFENSSQRVQTTTEAEFTAQFVSMMGNIPFFVSAIGGAVLLAILLACVNTMLMAAREQTHDIGIMKALGFNDATMFKLLTAQALILCGAGGAAGIGLAIMTESSFAEMLGSSFPGYRITAGTLQFAALVTVAIGILAGVAPALGASRLRCVEALRRGN